MNIPRIMIAATGSGSGKTTITCALLQALTDYGKKVAAFKCGPDYIDPMFHKKVLGISSKNLDTFFTGEELTRGLFLESAAEKNISVIEGVMGLFDGLGGIKEEGSSYHLARTLKAPVILVIDAHGMGRSLLPLIAGYLQYDTEHFIQGVILNRMSKMFYEVIRPEIESNLPIKVLGYFPERKENKIDSRYLGLKLPDEIQDIQKQMKEIAGIIKDTVDMKQLLQIADAAVELKHTIVPLETSIKRNHRVPIGVAMDEAFCFYYEDNFRLLERLGAELVPFSPVRDSKLPKGIQGIILGGGYPEIYGEQLSNNVLMYTAIKEAISKGMPSIAECGGFLYLHEEMEITGKKVFPMVGIVKGKCFDTGKSVRFGYVKITEKENAFLKQGKNIKGHEFHYFDSTNNGQKCVAEKPISGRHWECIHASAWYWWGFPHLYYYSNQEYVYHFIERAYLYGKAQTCFY